LRPIQPITLQQALRKTTRAILSACLLVAGLAAGRPVVAGAASAARVTVDAGTVLGRIPATAFGMNTAVWDNNLLDASVPSLMRQAGVTMLRYPGGSTADNYHWQSNTVTDGGYTNPNDTFDAFMGVAQHTGAQPLITVNYGSNTTGTGGGDPAEAAAWVRYANVTKGYGVKYWEIGNEVYGNGTYPNGWETDLHSVKGPVAYANNALAYADAMKREDPSIKVGVALTTPGYWPDGQAPDWNSNVLSIACQKIDFVDVHWYPVSPTGTDADLLNSPREIGGIVAKLRDEIGQHCGSNASHIQILTAESNTNDAGKQRISLVDALFLPDEFMTWLEAGVSNTSWWDLHNGIDTGGNYSSGLYGGMAYGDLGILADGTCASGVCEPVANTPFPPYYGLQMLSHLGGPGDQMVAASADQADLAVHAVRRADGSLAVLLINKSLSASYDVSVALAGYTPAPDATVYTYGMNSAGITTSSRSGIGAPFVQTIPPYGLATVVLRPAAQSQAISIPVTASPNAAPTSTLTPSTATPPSLPTTAQPVAVTIGGASVAPGLVVPDGVATLTDTITVNQSLSGAIVDFYVYDAAGRLVSQIPQNPVTLAAGIPQVVSTSWTVPAGQAPGAYTLKVGVFGPGWSPLYAWSDQAATFSVGASVQTPTVPSAPTSAPTNTATSTATRTDIAANTATATATNTDAPPTATPTNTLIPATATSPAIPTSVSPLTVTVGNTSVTPGRVVSGSTAALITMVTATAPLANAIVDFYVYDAAGRLVSQIPQSPVTLTPNAPLGIKAMWTAPAGQAAGAYTLKVGVFGPGWSPLYAWDDRATAFTVEAPATPTPLVTTSTPVPPTGTVTRTLVPPTATRASKPTATATRVSRFVPPTATPPVLPATAQPLNVNIEDASTMPQAIAHKRTMTFTATVTATMSFVGSIVDFYVYDAAGRLVAQIWRSPITFAANAPSRVKTTWTVPASQAAGAYTLKVGVFGPWWSPLYGWSDRAATFSLR